MSTNAFSQLSRECARSDAQDRAQLRRLHEHVRQVTEGQRGGGQPQLDFLLDTATDLMRYLADGALPTQEELLNIVTRLVVNAECATNARVEQRGVHAPATQAATPPSAPVAPQEPDPGTQVQDAGLDLAVRPDGESGNALSGENGIVITRELEGASGRARRREGVIFLLSEPRVAV